MSASTTETGPTVETETETEAAAAPPADGSPPRPARASSDELAAAAPLLLQALALVVATTMVFWFVGLFRDGSSGSDVVAAGSQQDTEQAEGDGATNGIPASPEAEPDAAEGEAAEAGEPAPADEEAPADGEDVAAEEEGAADEGAEAEVATPEGGIAPASVSIQVLDAVLDDGGAAARAVAEELEGAGYDVVVVNDASVVYDETTVFFSVQSGQPAAEQVSEAFDYPRTGIAPANLSDSVQLHVVVGRDRA